MNDNHKVFIDFDGTITANDVGYELFKRFTNGETESDVQLYREGKLNSLQCLSRECNIWNRCSPQLDEVWRHLDSQPLTPGFAEFLTFLQKSDLEPVILSEGFDFYIKRVLKAHKLDHLQRITNTAQFEGNCLIPHFPYYEQGCKECSNCKGFHINRLREPMMSAIYIGDGHSDLHASRQADIVFARSHLMELLADEKRYFIKYKDFFDIANEIEIILERGIFAKSERINFCRIGSPHHSAIQRLWESGEVMRFVGYSNGLGWSQSQYESIWAKLENKNDAIHLALEDKSGNLIGEAMIAFPDGNGFCEHDLKLLPEYWGQGLGEEAWTVIIDRTKSRWPDARLLVTPAIENSRAIHMYRRLGFEFDSGPLTWKPLEDRLNAIPVSYRRMVRRQI